MNQCRQSQFIEAIHLLSSQYEVLFLQDQKQFISCILAKLQHLIFGSSDSSYFDTQSNPNPLNTTKLKPYFIQTDPKTILNQILNLQNKLKYPLSFLVVFLLTKHKEKPLNTMLGFYYDIVNHLVKQLKKDLQDDKKVQNKKLSLEEKQQNERKRKACTSLVLDGFQVILSVHQISKENSIQMNQSFESTFKSSPYLPMHQIMLEMSKSPNPLKPSKILKIVCCILCIPQSYLSQSSLIQFFLLLLSQYSQSEQIMQKLEYKLVSKLQKYRNQTVSENEIIGMLKILLFRFQHKISWDIVNGIFPDHQKEMQEKQVIRPRHSQVLQKGDENSSFCTASKNKKVFKLIQLLSKSFQKPSKEQKNLQPSPFGYHLTCLLVKTVSQMQRISQENPQIILLKQLIFFLSTTYFHHLQSFVSEKQTVKFYNTIINSLINQSDIFVLKICLNFIQNEAILGFSVQKLKSLFKLLTNIAKKLKKMDPNQQKSNKSIKSNNQIQQKTEESKQRKKKEIKKISEILLNEEVELAKLKISRIIRIFEQLTQRYKDKCQQLKFPHVHESKISLQKIKETNSVSFSLHIDDSRKSYPELKIQSEKTKFPKLFVQQNDEIRMVKFIVGKSQTYEIFLRIRTTSNSSSSKNSSFISIKEQSNNFFDDLIAQPSFVIDIIVCLQHNVLIEDQIKNVEKIADSYFEFIVCISCNKPSDQKGSKILIKINQKLIEVASKVKRNEITSFELGLQCKSQVLGKAMKSSVKKLYFFSKEVQDKFLEKNDFSSLSSSISHHLINLLGTESVTYRISESPENLIQDLNNEPKLFFKKQLKIATNNVTKSRTLTFVEIFEQIGGLNSIFYILDKINKSYACHFGQKTQNFFVEIFKILKNLAANDKENFIFKEVKNSYAYISYFLFLIFRRNQHLASQRNSHFIESIFKFLMFFSSYFTKDQTIKQYPSPQVFEMELIFIKEILCYFELWFDCSLEIQSYVFETLQNFIKNERYTFALFSIDLHSKILSSMTFFYCNQSNPLKNKFEQRILSLCEQLYDRVFQILDEKSPNDNFENLDLILALLRKVNKDKTESGLTIKEKEKSVEKKNGKQTTKMGLLLVLEGCIYRDVNETLSLVYLLIVYHSRNFNEPSYNLNENLNFSNAKQTPQKLNLKNSISSFNQSSTNKSFVSSNSQTLNLPTELKTCLNLLSYFSKNFVEKNHVFSKIGDEWSYVISIFSLLQEILLSTKVKSELQKSPSEISPSSCQTIIIIKLYEILFKIVNKKTQLFNYLVNSLEKLIMHPKTSFLQSFFLVSEILHLNKKYSLDIIDTAFFLLSKKLNSYQQNQRLKKLVLFFNESELQKILYKMADATLTYSRDFEDFLYEIFKEIQSIQKDQFAFDSQPTKETKQQKTQIVENESEPFVNENLQTQVQPKSSETIIDMLQLNQKQSLQGESNQTCQIFKISKSHSALLKIFKDYQDTLFSICYQTSSISQQNKQWIQNYLTKKFQDLSFDPKDFLSKNILKDKRINSQSNFKIGNFCSSQSTVYFMFNVLERICIEEQMDALELEKLNKIGLKSQLSPIRQSPSKENTNSVSSRTLEEKNHYIETEQKINEQIDSLLTISEPISFFLCNQKLSITSIHSFFTSFENFQKTELQYSFFNKSQNLSLLTFIKTYLYGQALKHLFQNYSHSEQHQNQVEKPVQALKRTEKTLKALEILKSMFTQNRIDFEGFYNCLIPQTISLTLKNTKSTLTQIPIEKHQKITNDLQTSLKGFLQAWYINTNPAFKVNPHDREKLKTPKKLNLDEKNLFDLTIQKLKFVCYEVEKDENKINEVFAFFNQQTRGNVAKQFLPLINKLISTFKYVLQAKHLLTILESPASFNPQFTLIGCPKNPFPSLSQKTIEQYSQSLIQKFNKILETERKKSERSEAEFKKNEKENQFWLQIQERDYEKKDQIFELDQKEIGPFGFYKLNIKPSSDSIQQINYPRRKMFSQMKNSQTSAENEQQENNEDSILLSRTRVFDLSFTQTQNLKQRRNTLLEITPINNVTQKIEGLKNPINPSEGIFWCQLVTKRGVYAGKLYVKSQYVEFRYFSHLRLPNQPVYTFSTGKFHQINSLTQEQRSHLSPLKIPYKRCRMFTRRYILRHTAVELFSKPNHQSYFINLFWNHERTKFLNQVREKFEQTLEDRRQEFMKKQFTEQWKIGILSNFEYLCLVNQYSGRSTNDLAQYYVFPWVVTNYSSKNGFIQLDEEFLKDKSNLRDLSCPPGKLSQEKFMKLKTRLMQLDFCEPEERFLYGTMFSNPTVLYNFFIRLEPYIHLHWQHQGKRIDHADRLFSAIQEQFNSVLIASSDMKELTPQFYYWPQFLKNRSYIDLGQKQNKQEVDDVILPPWAHSPEEFIFKMRFALESNAVSQHLHEWIDLTFGYKIKYENAQQFDNLYHFNCYERSVDYFEEFGDDVKQIRSLQVSISEFGQIPQALFDEPHPAKNLRHEFIILDRFVNVKYEKQNPKASQSSKIGFETCKQGLFVWTSSSVQFKKSYITQNYSYDEQHKVLPSSGDYSRLISFEDQCWLTLSQGILRIYIKKLMKFQQTVEAQCIDIIGTYFVFAKKSSLCVTQYDGARNQLLNKRILYGHKDEIVHIICSKSLDLILSIDIYGFVILHELQSLSFLRNFQLPLEKEWSRSSFSKQAPSKLALKVQIHEMGYFIFLLNQKKLVVVTFLGEIFLQHDIEIISEIRGKREEQKITDMIVFRQDQSVLLIGTDKGNIYEIDFIEIKRYYQLYPFKTYTNIHANILELLLSQYSSLMSTKSSKKLSTFSSKSEVEVNFFRPIYHMTIEKIPGDKISLYQLIVQYEDGEILCFYQEKYLGKQLKQNQKLKQIGLFF